MYYDGVATSLKVSFCECCEYLLQLQFEQFCNFLQILSAKLTVASHVIAKNIFPDLNREWFNV